MKNTNQILRDFKKEKRQRYGKDFFLEFVTVGGKKQVVVLTKKLAQELQALLGKTLKVKSIEGGFGIETIINSEVVNLYTNRKNSLEFLADQLLKGERVRVFKFPTKRKWLAVAVRHDFEHQAPVQLGWIYVGPKDLVKKPFRKIPAKNILTDLFIQLVEEHLFENSGISYYLGGKTKDLGMDCSSFVQIVIHATHGLHLPRLSRWQALIGKEVKQNQIKPGDLVYFHNQKLNKVTHIGFVYQITNLELPIIVHCAFKANAIKLDDLNKSKWLDQDLIIGGFRRII